MKTAFTNKLEGGVTSLSDRIDINGYYRYWNRNEWGGYESIASSKDTAYIDMIFFDDGTFLYNTFVGENFSTYNEYFESISKKGKTDIFYKGDWWGIYSMEGDTIKTQFLRHAANFTPWWGGERWFLKKNQHTLQVIFAGFLFDETEEDKQKGKVYVKTASDVIFHPLEVIPPSYAWFKENKFFWRSERDWRNYMEFIKEK
ncbi:MAG: hypothetical protein IT249_01035 [Chitinophagaceae bacterium]|nr:hypothetical protein [Chitinophagaceae bacterium]